MLCLLACFATKSCAHIKTTKQRVYNVLHLGLTSHKFTIKQAVILNRCDVWNQDRLLHVFFLMKSEHCIFLPLYVFVSAQNTFILFFTQNATPYHMQCFQYFVQRCFFLNKWRKNLNKFICGNIFNVWLSVYSNIYICSVQLCSDFILLVSPFYERLQVCFFFHFLHTNDKSPVKHWHVINMPRFSYITDNK